MRLLAAALIFCFIGSAQTPLEARLDRQLHYWQRRLRLSSWNLQVHVVRKWALQKDTWGDADWDSDKKTGIINVLAPEDYNLRGIQLRQDMECTIVHELVHIELSPRSPDNPEAQEDEVNRVMNSLLGHPCPN